MGQEEQLTGKLKCAPDYFPPHSTLNIEAEGKPEAHRGASEAPAQDQNQVPGAGIL